MLGLKEKCPSIPTRCRWCINAYHIHGQHYLCSEQEGAKDKNGKKIWMFGRVLGDDRCRLFRPFVKKYVETMRPQKGCCL